MKKTFLLFVFTLISNIVLGATFSVAPSKDTVTTSEVFMIDFTSYNREQISHQSLPQLQNGAVWLTNITHENYQISNNQYVYISSIGIKAPDKVGEFIIPPFKIKVGNVEHITNEMKIKVISSEDKSIATQQSKKIKLSDAVFAKVVTPIERKKYYIGEEIPLDFVLYFMPSLNPEIASYPQFYGIGNSVFKDYPSNNNNRKFAPFKNPQRVKLNGYYFNKLIFSTAIRPLNSGKISPSGKINLRIPEQNQSRSRNNRARSPFDDDFFDSFFASNINYFDYELKAQSDEKITIIAPPAPPKNAYDLKLIGDWKIYGSFDKKTIIQGEAFTFTLIANGNASAETLIAPEISLANFRIYPPEVKKNTQNSATQIVIKYAIIPLKSGKISENINFTFFNPITEKYDIKSFPLNLDILPSSIAPTKSSVVDVASENELPTLEEKAPNHDYLFYQKENIGENTLMPLYKNKIVYILILLFTGTMLIFVYEWLYKRKNNSKLKLKQQQKLLLSQLLKKINRSNNVIDRDLREEIIAYLISSLQLPSGSTATNVAECIDEEKIKSFLLNSNSNDFLPESEKQNSQNIITNETKDLLIKFMKKIVMVVIVFSSLCSIANGENYFEKGNEDFVAGKYIEANEAYKKCSVKGTMNANLLYNLGNTQYQLGNLPLARYYLIQASLINPNDSEIQENLKLVERKLFLNTPDEHGHPLLMLKWLRDRIRPDNYLLILSILYLIFCIAFIFRRKISRELFISIIIGITILAIASFGAFITQKNGIYNANRVVVTSRNVELRTLPADNIGNTIKTISGGENALLIDQRANWSRINIDSIDGWVKSKDIKKIFAQE